MSRGSDQRVADILEAIARCRRYVGVLDDEGDLVWTYLPPLAEALRRHAAVD